MNLSLRSLGAALMILAGAAAHAGPQHAITLYGEPPKYPADFQHFDYVNPDAPKGGLLRQQSVGGFDSLNPFIAKGNAVNVGLIYDSLTYHSPDEPFTEYGLLAEKIELAPDNSYVRFHLNPAARFHDGQPVTAEDVVFTFNTLIEKGHPQYRSYYADVAEVVAEDARRVRFDFRHGNNRELPMILGQLQILPAHWWKDRDFSHSSLEAPLGSGPYRIGQVDAGSSLTFERVKDWWAKDLPVARGMYNFDQIRVDFYRDGQVALEAFKAGRFDVNLEYSAKDWATGYDSPALRDGRFVKVEIPNHNPAGMQGYVFNLRKPMFQDRRVREAIAQLFDFEWADKRLFYNAYKRTDSYFENSELASSGLPDAAELAILEPLREQLPPEVFTLEFRPPVSDGSGIIREQSRRAFQLLTEAGYRVENDKMVGPDGRPLAFEFLNFQPNLERVLLPFKRNLEELGIDMQIRRVDASQYVNRLRSRDFEMTSAIWPQSNSPGNEQREFWHSSSADNPGSRNYMGLRDPAIDQLVDGLINADSRQALITHARALDRALLWGHYLVPNYYIDTWRLAYATRLGRPAVTPKYDYGLMTWWEESPVNAPRTPQTAPDRAGAR